MREHTRVRISSIEHADLNKIEALRSSYLRGDRVPTAAIQNIKRMVSSFFLARFYFSLQQNPAFAD